MDWSNERYVRLYVRDTLTWKRLRFDGQTVLMHLLRKLDRSGRLALDGMEPGEALSILTDVPEDFATLGMARLLDLEVVLVRDGHLWMPNFREAQEAKASEALRKRESRARMKADADVTKRDTSSGDDSETGHERHAESHAVTPSHTRSPQPSLAEPSLAERECGRAPEPAPSSTALAHLREVIAGHLETSGQPAPKLGRSVLEDVLPRVRSIARIHECDFDVAAKRLATAALELSDRKGKEFVWALQDVRDVPRPAEHGSTESMAEWQERMADAERNGPAYLRALEGQLDEEAAHG